MIGQYLHDGWTCRHLADEGNDFPVCIPDDAMLREKRSLKSNGGLYVGWFEGYDYLYTKHITMTGDDLQRHHVLEFEGIYRKAEVFINGNKAAYRPYGYTNFYVDCDPYLRAGDNVIEVIARNADQPNSRWYSGAGIYRPVRLWSSGQSYIHLNGVKISTLSLDPAVIEVKVKTSGEGPVQITVMDDDRVLYEASGEERSFIMKIPALEPWSPAHPKLYQCRVSYAGDTAVETFGVRTLSWGKQGLLINGERIILRGACIHHDNGVMGAVCHPDAIERKVRILQKNGYNAIRSAHNPCSKAALSVCDRLGMLVLDEYVDQWYIHKTQHDYADDFSDWWQQDLTDMVDKDFNHPCVIMYSTGNEVAETAQKKGIALTQTMTDFLHQLDRSRPVTCGINIFFNFLNTIGFGQYSDQKAAKEAERNAKAREQGKKTKERAVGSQFFNHLAAVLGADFMKFGATLHGSDLTTRAAYAAMDIAGYNYGEKRYEHDLKKYPERLILGTETFCADAYRFWELAKTEPRLLGDFVWAGMDYLGEVAVGEQAENHPSPEAQAGVGWLASGSGRINLIGQPTGEALYTRIAFEQEQGPLMAVLPLGDKIKHARSAWKLTTAIPSWSFQGCEGEVTTVEVYSRCETVALLLNGKQIGTAKPQKCIARFKAAYQPGILEAIAYDEHGTIQGRTQLVSAGEETMLRLEPERDEVVQGGLAFVRIRLTDTQGITKSTAQATVHMTIEGGRLVGCGSASPYTETSYLAPQCTTYHGEALLIAALDHDMTITATCDYGTAVTTIKEKK